MTEFPEEDETESWTSFEGMINLLHRRIAEAGDDIILKEAVAVRLGITETEFEQYMRTDRAPDEVIDTLSREYRHYLKGITVQVIRMTSTVYPEEPDFDNPDEWDLA